MKEDSLFWSGSENMFLDNPQIVSCGSVHIGFYGGNTQSGQFKNEDGAIVLTGSNWEFCLILDAHNSSESGQLLIQILKSQQEALRSLLESENGLLEIQSFILDLLRKHEVDFAQVRGETACLICVRKQQFLYWFSIGDCLLYLFHSELAKMGQFAINQRQFYEWIGQINSLALPIPCYSSGTRELRQGKNVILISTDGLVEYENSPFTENKFTYEFFTQRAIKEAVYKALEKVHKAKGRDSTTIIAYTYINKDPGLNPTG